jgi:hypothetical protein
MSGCGLDLLAYKVKVVGFWEHYVEHVSNSQVKKNIYAQ